MTCGIPRLSPCDLIHSAAHALASLYWWAIERRHWVEIAPGHYVEKRDLEQIREMHFGPLSPFPPGSAAGGPRGIRNSGQLISMALELGQFQVGPRP